LGKELKSQAQEIVIMNWSRGFVRLWTVISSLWVVGFILVGANSLLKPSTQSIVYGKGQQSFRDLDWRDQDSINELVKKGVLEVRETKVGNRAYWQVGDNTIVDINRGLMVDKYARHQHFAQAKSSVLPWLAGMMSLPLFLLLSGVVAHWILRGFAR
jgi:hypothetical protein